jgi:hypothetical protein
VRSPLAALAAAAVLALAGCTSDPAPSAPTTSDPNFGLPADASAAAAQAGLPMLGEEHLNVHYHAHLDLVVRGQAITVPAYIGIDRGRSKIAPLHTHTPDGIVHIESATDVPFTLGQFFAEWGHPISATAVGSVSPSPGSETLRVYRNGDLVEGDPSGLRFEPHDEIVVWIGPAAQTPSVPSTYDFPNGL